MNKSGERLGVLILLLGFLASFYWFFPTYSADLMAVWLAGKFLAEGQLDQVYPAVTDYFRMYPPSEWRPFMAETYDYTGPIYPFIYPPLWAKLASFLSDVNFWRVTAVALAVNSALQMIIVWLAWRAAKPDLNPAIFMGLGAFFLLGTHVGTISLQQNQPQVFVSFLLVLTVERSRNNAPVAAGIALALAASLKLYPALFALFWLVSGNRRALVSFLLAGLALGLTSLVWVGWPLHRAFLDQISLISGSVLMTAISFNLDSAIAQLFYMDTLHWVPGLEPVTEAVPDPGWYSMQRPPLWRLLSTGLLLASVAWVTALYARADHDTRHAVIWPLGLTVVALLSPLSWVYYFIPSVAFSPVIIDRLGARRGGLLWFASIVLIFGPFVKLYRFTENWDNVDVFVYQWAGFLSFSILAYGFWQASRHPKMPAARS